MELRTAITEDTKLLFDWANDTDVRSNAINGERIEWENHVQWFNSKLNSGNTHIFIAIHNNVPVGQIRFDKADNAYVIDYSVDRKYRGKGMGLQLVKKGIDELKAIVAEKVKVTALVKKGNGASEKIFRNLGFEQNDTVNISNTECLSFSKELA